jgi:hypothetical protein
MVIVHLNGGLGNQMFQYAAGRRLAYIRQVELKLDLSWFTSQKLRTYRLDKFNIQAHPASCMEITALTGANLSPGYKTLHRLSQRLKPFTRRTVLSERIGIFEPGVLIAGGNVYLHGYWQSEKYFSEIQNLLRDEFTLKESPDQASLAIAADIKSTTAIGLHIRRGDYASDEYTNQYHGLCSLEYYQLSAARISEHFSDIHIFVFSDDPGWVRHHLKLDYPTTLIDQANSDIEDLWLMSQCRHFIIANSSFSWWAAWLGTAQEKQVFAPLHWFSDQQNESPHLIPPSWIRVDA